MPLDNDLMFESVDNGWILTYTGGRYHFDDPADINIRDIAHALSMICRYNGHIKKFYSVAEHSYLMARYALEAGYPAESAFAALMHDAAEAYVGDVTTPLKRLLGNEYNTIEAKANQAIFSRYKIDMSERSLQYRDVKELDRRIIVNETRELCLSQPDWLPKDLIPLAPSMLVIEAWTPDLAEYHFYKLFEELVSHVNMGRPRKSDRIVV